jgi:CBS domain-containing protein
MELARNLRRDPVTRLEPTPPRQVERTARVADAVELMRRENVGCGQGLDLPVADVMTADPETVSPRDPIRLAVRKLKAGGRRHLPVVDEERRPTGVLSVKRVVRYLVEHYPAAVYNQPPSDQAPDSAEGA